MVVKFFSNKKGGSCKAIDYLLNEREKLGTAKVLQGNPQLTKKIINSISYKQKTTVGCLSFEEKNISQKQKYKLMEDFENYLLPGMQDKYNILWVEHTDKDRLELNFVIPKIELETQKSLNPYYHKADLPRIEKWQDLQNLQYGYSNPKDPSKARILKTDTKKIGLSQDYEQLNKLLHNLVEKGKINNRNQLIELCENNNIEIKRKGKDYLSIKLPNSKKAKRFKGSIYNEQFTSIGKFREISRTAREEIEQYNRKNIQRECIQLREELKNYTKRKEQYYRKKYNKNGNKSRGSNCGQFEKNREFTRRKINKNNGNIAKENEFKWKVVNLSNSNIIDIRNFNSNNSNNVFYTNKTIQRETTNNFLLLDNKSQFRELKNDSVRTRINRRKRETYRKNREARREIYKRNVKNYEYLRKRNEQFGNNFANKIGRIGRIQQCNLQESKNHIQQIRKSEPAFNGYTEFKKRVENYIKTAREHIKNTYEKIKRLYKKFDFKQKDLEGVFASQDVYKDILKKEMSFKDLENTQKQYDISANENKKQIVLREQKKQQQQSQRRRKRSYDYEMGR